MHKVKSLSSGILLTASLWLAASGPAAALEPTALAVKAPGVTVKGRLDAGQTLALDWATASSVACFPANHFDAFSGKHVLYRFDLPAASTAKITLKPKGGGDMNLYAYRAAQGERLVPPAIQNTQCEASYATAIRGTKPNPGVDESVEMMALQSPYTIYVGVAGYKGVTSGEFELVIQLTTAEPAKTGRITKVGAIAVTPGAVKVAGRIDDGVEIDLGWATASNVACFPANHFDAFSGKHVLYRFDLPAASTAKITLKPKGGGGDLNLYAYRAAPGDKMVPPAVMNTQCEASYASAVQGTRPNPNDAESVEMVAIQSPYSIYVGVAGYKGVTAGAFELVVELTTAAPPKAGRITKVGTIAVKPGTTKVAGKLDEGVEIDLDWAQRSSVACFPGTHFDAFSGKHVLYRFDLPAASTAKITLEPKGGGDMNLYAYRAGPGDKAVPPDVGNTSCEASYATAVPGTKPNPGEPESVEMVAIQNPYAIYVGVAGYKGVTSGEFELAIELVTAAPAKTGKLESFTPIAVKPGETKVAGKLDGGVEIDLDWAQRSSVACFPGNHFDAFSGKHVLYRFDLPAKSTAKILLRPRGSGDMNLYAYRAGVGERALPPDLGATSCEASYESAVQGTRPNPGKEESVEMVAIQNPYSIYVGVAGYKGVTSGDFELVVQLVTAEPPKAGKLESFTPIAVKPGDNKVAGKLDGGVEIDLDWAQRSSVACFPGNHFDAFSGKHVLYRFDLPAKSTAKILLRPKGSGDMNLYAYRAGVGDKALPPDLGSTSCEASYETAIQGTRPNPGEEESVEMVAIQNPYSIYVGVAGYKGVTSGEFELVVQLVTAEPPKTGRITKVNPLQAEAGKTVTLEGQLAPGVEIDLAWAEASNVACFGGHRAHHFAGKHVLYRFEQPPGTSLAVKVVPKDPKLDLSLYVYRAGAGDTTTIPPDVSSVSCEASYGNNDLEVSPNPGEPESVDGMITLGRPYTVYVGVAGAKGVTAGDFTLEVDLKNR